MHRLLRILALALALSLPAAAGAADRIELRVFVKEGCPHCAEAKIFLAELAARRPDVAITWRHVDADPAALDELLALSDAQGVTTPGVPTFVARGRILVGWRDAGMSGPLLLALLDETSRGESVETRLLGNLSVERLGLPVFTIALGLLDGFNPCATWVLVFLLSLLVGLHDRRRIALMAGTFVAASGLVYLAFMAAWLEMFLLLGVSPTVRWILAGIALVVGAINVKDYFAFKRGVTLSIPESAKPGLVARSRAVLRAQTLAGSLIGLVTLALLVNVVELACTAGFPAVFTHVLASHHISGLARAGYMLLYVACYMLDDALLVTVAVVTLRRWHLTERAGRLLKLVAGAVMIALGMILLLRPDLLVATR